LLRLEIPHRPLVESVLTDERALTQVGTTFQSNILIKFSTSRGTTSAAIQPINKNVAMVEVQYRLDATVASGVPYKPLPLVSVKAGSLYVPASDKATYDLRLRFIGEDGRSGPWLDMPNIYVSGKTNPPGYVDQFKLIEQPGGIKQFFWEMSARPIDLFAFEVRFCLGSVELPWDEMIPLFAKDHRASSHENAEPKSNEVYTFAIKAVDSSGLMSAVPHYITEALDGDAFGTVESFVLPHELRWPGTRSDCEIVGPNLENTGALTWDDLDFAWDSTDETWKNTPISPIVYEHPVFDTGAIASRIVRLTSLVSGSTVSEISYSSDGVTYSAWAGAPSPDFSFRYIKTRWTVSGTNPAMYRAQFVIYT